MDRPCYLNTSRLRIAIGCTWHLFQKYWDLDLIGTPDATVAGKPAWLMSSVEGIRERIAEYERNKSAAIHNSLTTV
jgi:hypothetical protein